MDKCVLSGLGISVSQGSSASSARLLVIPHSIISSDTGELMISTAYLNSVSQLQISVNATTAYLNSGVFER
jgi:hypothetical protein